MIMNSNRSSNVCFVLNLSVSVLTGTAINTEEGARFRDSRVCDRYSVVKVRLGYTMDSVTSEPTCCGIKFLHYIIQFLHIHPTDNVILHFFLLYSTIISNLVMQIFYQQHDTYILYVSCLVFSDVMWISCREKHMPAPMLWEETTHQHDQRQSNVPVWQRNERTGECRMRGRSWIKMCHQVAAPVS